MNRVDFMNQLESLLQSISSTEREEAIQYYNDYFDDAGKENEQEVIEALGNPARVAENIKRDLAVNGCGEGYAQKVKASDRVLMEYGKNVPEDSEENRDSKEIRDSGRVSGSGQTDGGVREQPADMSEGLTEKSAGWQRDHHGVTGRVSRQEARPRNMAEETRTSPRNTVVETRTSPQNTAMETRTRPRNTARRTSEHLRNMVRIPAAREVRIPMAQTERAGVILLRITGAEVRVPGAGILQAIHRKSIKRETVCQYGRLQC